MKRILHFALIVFVVLAAGIPASSAVQAAATGALTGRVTDPSAAVIPGATVTVTDSRGSTQTVATSDIGVYRVTGLLPGSYTLRAVAPQFVESEGAKVEVRPGRTETLDIRLEVAMEKQEVTVEDEVSGRLSLTAESSVGAVVLRGEDLDALSDDPDDLAAELQALAGPSAGPQGGQVFVDGFSGVSLPPKESIREIRINSDPFSAQYDQPGFGRIEIFTKPGTDKFRGEAWVGFSDESLNSRNPYAANRPPYQLRIYDLELSGPISKKSSFFLDFQRREIDENAVINATILSPELVPTPFSEAVVTPERRTRISPRIDYQLSKNHTLVGRYRYSRDGDENSGIGGFSLPSLAYDDLSENHLVQLTETAVLSERSVNEFRLQFRRRIQKDFGDTSVPTTSVLEAFRDGGNQVGRASSTSNNWELQNYTTYLHGPHTLKFGTRFRNSRVSDFSPQNFGGTFTFGGGVAPELDANNQVVVDGSGQPVMVPITSLERYRRTLLFLDQGLTPEEIRSLGGGATQFSLNSGDPLAGVSQYDLGLYFLDDWRVRRNLTLSFGLRYETQNNVSDWTDWAPRVGFAWAPGGGQQSKTVVRGGSGIFYDRIDDNLTMQTLRFNGLNQLQYIVQDPDFYPLVPSPEELAGQLAPQVIRVMSPDARAPYMLHSAIGIERQLPWNTTVALTYTNSRSFHLLRSVSLSALPGSGAPISGADEVFQYETNGIFRQNQLIFNVRSRFHSRVSLFGFYALNKAMSDTDGAGSFPANPFDLRADYGRSSMDIRHRVFLGGSLDGPVGLRFNPFIILQSGRPFNITTGTDGNGDLIFADRPSFATDLSDPDVVVTALGAFDTTPDPGASIVPRNFGSGPSLTAVNLRLSKTWAFGASREGSADAGPGGGPPGDMIMIGGRGRRGRRHRGWRRGEESGKRYALTFSVSARNVLNITNPGTPIGNLSSPLFGESNSSAGFGRGGNAGNRSVMLQMRFSF